MMAARDELRGACEHCGKVWLHGDCYTTTSRMIRCIGQPQIDVLHTDGGPDAAA